MAVQSMLDNRLKKKKKTRQNKALIENFCNNNAAGLFESKNILNSDFKVVN
jgi:hypothetical protein